MLKRILYRLFLFAAAFLLVSALLVISGVVYVIVYPTRTVNFFGQHVGISVEKIRLHQEGAAEILGLQIQDVGKIGSLSAQWQWEKLSQHRLDSLVVRDMDLNIPKLQQKISLLSRISSSVSEASPSSSENRFPPVKIADLLIENARVTLEGEHQVSFMRAALHETPDQAVTLAIENLQAGELAKTDTLDIQWNWESLKNREIDTVKIFNANINVEKILQVISATAPAPTPTVQTPAQQKISPPIMVKHLVLEKMELALPQNQKASIEKMEFQGKLDEISKLILKDMRVGDFARVETVKIEWTWEGLARQEIEYLDVTGANISLNRLMTAYPSQTQQKPDANAAPSRGFHLKELRIRQSQLTQNIFGSRLPNFVMPIAQISPDLVFRDLHLGGSTDDPAASQPVEATIPNYTLTSPYDGISPMLSLGKIRIVFSWKGIQEKRIEQLQIIEPIIYIGNDLFWFADDLKNTAGAQDFNAPISKPDAPSEQPWTIGNFSVVDGRLAISAYGKKNAMLPFHFSVEPHFNLVVSELTQLHLKTQCEIPPTTIEYADYGPLKIENLTGKMEFSLPLGSQNANNIVNTLQIDRIQWKNLEASQGQMWLTYDAKGIYGGFYAKAYEGDIGGDITFYWDNRFSWIGSCYTKNMNIAPITQMLSPENFVMTGPIESRFTVRGESREIQGMGGIVNLNQNGKMQVIAIDDLLPKLPKDWTPLKQDLVSTALISFRDYDYQNGVCEFAYSPPQSFLKLRLKGLQGQRNFDIKWNDKINLPQ